MAFAKKNLNWAFMDISTRLLDIRKFVPTKSNSFWSWEFAKLCTTRQNVIYFGTGHWRKWFNLKTLRTKSFPAICIEVKMLFSFSLVVRFLILDLKVYYLFQNIKDRHHVLLEKRSLVELHLNVTTHKFNIEHKTDRTC